TPAVSAPAVPGIAADGGTAAVEVVPGPSFVARHHASGPTSEAIDPCEPVEELPLPTGFETLTAENVSIAWRPGEPAPTSPLVIAHLAAGVLAEAAQVTGTSVRSHLTVVLYPTKEDFQATGAPSWSSGLYDGLVRLPPDLASELGIRLSTLRHEIMHAQLHAA